MAELNLKFLHSCPPTNFSFSGMIFDVCFHAKESLNWLGLKKQTTYWAQRSMKAIFDLVKIKPTHFWSDGYKATQVSKEERHKLGGKLLETCVSLAPDWVW